MPRTCSVPLCNSNYKSVLKTDAKIVPTFKFPTDDGLRSAWIKAIHRDFQPSTNSAICRLHFKDSDFTDYNFHVKNKRLKLKKNAVPSIFPNHPKYLSVEPCNERQDPSCRRDRELKRIERLNEDFLQSDHISDFNALINGFEQNVNYVGFEKKIFDNCLVVYMLKEQEEVGCEFVVRITVRKNMLTNVVLNNVPVSSKSLDWVLSSNNKLTLWSQLNNLLVHYRNDQPMQIADRSFYLKKAVANLELANKCDEETDYSRTIEILANQLQLLYSKKPCYHINVTMMAFLIYSHSAATYKILKSFLALPSKRHLQSISSSMHVSPDHKISGNDENYLKHVFEAIEEKDRIIALLIDEIYISSNFEFKANNIVGTADNCSLKPASTIMAFMAKSVFGSYKDIVRLLPVISPTSQYLYSSTMQIVSLVQKVGFRVAVIITDNNKINQALFNLLSPSGLNYFPNPDRPSDSIYLQFDTVHLFKNIRNNWINLKNHRKTFVYPDFDTKEVKRASFEDFRSMYESESHLQIRKAYKLNWKALFPNSLERQNVGSVNNIFHDSTISALKTRSEMKDTADFCCIIRKWWDTVNVKSTLKGTIKRNDWALPFTTKSDPRVEFLKNFIEWLHIWNQSENNNGVLSKDTYKALVFSTQTIIDLINIGLDTPNVKYVLTGKFQTDDLEKRFGLYRNMAGCSYRVSYSEVIESEKKIRIHNIFAHFKKNSERLLHEDPDNSLHESFDAQLFEEVFNSTYIEDVEIDVSANLYTSGFAANSIAKKIACLDCKSLIVEEKGGTTKEEYFNNLQRGGLSKSTPAVGFLLFHMQAIFQEILRNVELKKTFFSTKIHKGLLCFLTIGSAIRDRITIDLDKTCHCGLHSNNIFSSICIPLANTLLNNFVKQQKDQTSKDGNSKCRKLGTFQV